MLEGVIFQASRQYFNKLANDFSKLGISQMSSKSSARFSKDKGGPALGLRQIGIREWNDDYITY